MGYLLCDLGCLYGTHGSLHDHQINPQQRLTMTIIHLWLIAITALIVVALAQSILNKD